MEKIKIDLKQKNKCCEIRIEENLITKTKEIIKEFFKNPKYITITDKNVAEIYNLQTNEKNRLIVIEPGEKSKNINTYAQICEQIIEYGIDRKTIIVACGGGVVGDLAGFVAATILRGVRLVQIPTSLLAQVDSSVGGKTAINSQNGKNLVGAFHQPSLVIIDPKTLESLPKREFKAGYAEVLKYAIIKNEEFFNYLTENMENIRKIKTKEIKNVIATCCKIKAEIVQNDELENGERALLNFGHTFGHVLEKVANYNGTVIHGEAVAVGMVLAAKFAEKITGFKQTEKIITHLKKTGLPVSIRQLAGNVIDWEKNLTKENNKKMLLKDKKVDDEKLTLILPEKIGQCKIYKNIDAEEVSKFIQEQVNI